MSISTQAVTDFLTKRAEHNGHLGSIEVLEIDQLRIDPYYQRDLVQNLVDDIALAYDPLTAGVVLVSRRESGDLYIVDGQHKTAGAKQSGRDTVLALVVNGLTQKEEAQLRLAANVKRADTALEKFKAKLAAEDPAARQIHQIVSGFDVRINTSPNLSVGINAVTALENIFSRDNTGILLTRTLETIRDAWGTPQGQSVSSGLLKGVAYFLNQHGGAFDRARLIERMQVEGPAAIQRMARNQKSVMGGALWLNVYRALVETYNFRLGDASKLEARTKGWTNSGLGSGDGAGWD